MCRGADRRSQTAAQRRVWERPNYSTLRNVEDGTEAKRNKLVVRALKDTEQRALWWSTPLACARR